MQQKIIAKGLPIKITILTFYSGCFHILHPKGEGIKDLILSISGERNRETVIT